MIAVPMPPGVEHVSAGTPVAVASGDRRPDASGRWAPVQGAVGAATGQVIAVPMPPGVEHQAGNQGNVPVEGMWSPSRCLRALSTHAKRNPSHLHAQWWDELAALVDGLALTAARAIELPPGGRPYAMNFDGTAGRLEKPSETMPESLGDVAREMKNEGGSLYLEPGGPDVLKTLRFRPGGRELVTLAKKLWLLVRTYAWRRLDGAVVCLVERRRGACEGGTVASWHARQGARGLIAGRRPRRHAGTGGSRAACLYEWRSLGPACPEILLPSQVPRKSRQWAGSTPCPSSRLSGQGHGIARVK